MNLIFALFAGVLMGVFIQKVRASSPAVLAKNLRLEDFSVIRFMALAVAVGALGSVLLGWVTPLHLSIKPLYVVGVGLGGLIFGVGFALAGYCPGTCLVGIAEGRKDALLAVLGALAGAFAFTLVFPRLGPLLSMLDFGALTLSSATGLPGALVALVFAALILLVLRRLPKDKEEKSP